MRDVVLHGATVHGRSCLHIYEGFMCLPRSVDFRASIKYLPAAWELWLGKHFSNLAAIEGIAAWIFCFQHGASSVGEA